MTDGTDGGADTKLPESGKVAKISRGALQVVAGAVPFAGGVLSAIAGAWSEGEQEKVNRFLKNWVRMLQDEIGVWARRTKEISSAIHPAVPGAYQEVGKDLSQQVADGLCPAHNVNMHLDRRQ